jgi:glycosyltransferase involved in cell wall biosynthesis
MTRRILHIIRSQSLGGSTLSPLRQAEAEWSANYDVRVWGWIQQQKEQFKELSDNYDFSIQSMTGVGLSLRLLSLNFPWNWVDVVNLQSGLARLSPNLASLRRFIPGSTAFIVTLRGPSQYEPHTEVSWRAKQMEYSQFVSAIIVPSEMERQIQIEAGIDPAKIFAVPNIMDAKPGKPGILRDRLGLGPTVPLVLFCGRISPRKSPLQTIDAFRSVLKRYPQAVLVMAGEGELLETCKEKAQDLGNSVVFLGHVQNVQNLYADANLFVGPSLAESFGRTAMEAGLARTPMVLGRIKPWTGYFSEGFSCEFADPYAPKDIAEKIIALLADQAYAQKLGQNAYEIVMKQFSKEAALSALEQAYQFALQTRS